MSLVALSLVLFHIALYGTAAPSSLLAGYRGTARRHSLRALAPLVLFVSRAAR
jgi:hypothetical protein